MLTKSRSAKAAVAAAIMLLGAGTAAAAGALPGAVQDAASAALDKVSVSIPDSHSDGHAGARGKSADHTSSDASDDTDGDASEATTSETGPDDHAMFGLCTAQAAGGQAHADAFPFDCDASHPGKPDDPGSQGRAHHPTDPSAEGSSDDAAQTGTDTAAEHDGDASATGAAASSAGADNRGDHGRP